MDKIFEFGEKIHKRLEKEFGIKSNSVKRTYIIWKYPNLRELEHVRIRELVWTPRTAELISSTHTADLISSTHAGDLISTTESGIFSGVCICSFHIGTLQNSASITPSKDTIQT